MAKLEQFRQCLQKVQIKAGNQLQGMALELVKNQSDGRVLY